MHFIDLIERKKHKKPLNEKQIQFFINNVVNKTLPDYQISAFLMALWFNGLSTNELYFLTKAMIASGETVSFHPKYQKPIVDKHSTGGIGDKVTIALAPILTCFNLGVAKLSGRGLGFTGGTIDKLEALNINTDITLENAKKILQDHDMFIMAQTDNLVPADRFLYALRDVSATTDSLPLITASILSKKFALKTDYIFIDIKYGKGAFCQTSKIAQCLGEMMVSIAKKFHRNVKYELSDMNHVLGKTIGNAIEFKEAVDYLRNDLNLVGSDFQKLMEKIVVNILLATKQVKNRNEGIEQLKKVLKSKEAFNKLCAWVNSQNGNSKAIINNNFFHPKHEVVIKAEKSGKVNYISPVALAEIGISLGTGRKVKTDVIDFQAGLYLHVKDNERVQKNHPVLTLYSSTPISSTIIKDASCLIKIN